MLDHCPVPGNMLKKKKRISQIHTIQNENLMEDGNEWFGDEQRWSIKKTLSFASSRVGYGWRFLDIIPVFLMMLSFLSFFVFFSLLIIIISITFCICTGTQQYPRPRCYRVIFDPLFFTIDDALLHACLETIIISRNP